MYLAEKGRRKNKERKPFDFITPPLRKKEYIMRFIDFSPESEDSG